MSDTIFTCPVCGNKGTLNTPEPISNIDREISNLRQTLAYEEAMYENCLKYPTDTPQFYKALDENRVRIDKLHNRLAELEATLKENK